MMPYLSLFSYYLLCKMYPHFKRHHHIFQLPPPSNKFIYFNISDSTVRKGYLSVHRNQTKQATFRQARLFRVMKITHFCVPIS